MGIHLYLFDELSIFIYLVMNMNFKFRLRCAKSLRDWYRSQNSYMHKQQRKYREIELFLGCTTAKYFLELSTLLTT